MKTIFDNLQENLSVAIELLSHTLEMVRTTPAPPVEGIKENIEVKIVPDKLETVKERAEPEDKTQLEKDIDEWKRISYHCTNTVVVKIGNGYFTAGSIALVRISKDRKTADVILNSSREITVKDCC